MICPKGKSGVLLMKCCYEKDEKNAKKIVPFTALG